MFVALGIRIQPAVPIRHIVHLSPVQLYIIYSHYLKTAQFSQKKITEKDYFFDLLYKVCLKHFSL